MSNEYDAFVIDNAEQIDLTTSEAAVLAARGLIYQPDAEAQPNYWTTPWGKSLDDVQTALDEIRA